jgi:hypothetical protein
MAPHLRPRKLHYNKHSQYRIRYTYHQAIEERRDYRRLHRYIRVGCTRRRGDGILYWQAQLRVPLLSLLRSVLARLSSHSSFSCGTSSLTPLSIRGAYFLAVDYKVHTTPTRRNVVSTSHMERSWSSRSRTIDASLRVLRSDARIDADRLCMRTF